MRHFSPLLGLAIVLVFAGSGFGQNPPPVAEPPQDELVKLLFGARSTPLEEARLAGLAEGTKLEVLTWQRTYGLALIRTRQAKPPQFTILDATQLASAMQNAGVEDFARFRKDFLTNRAFRDPATELLDLQSGLLRIENARWNFAYNERWAVTVKALVDGQSSGMGQSDLDQAAVSLSEARRGLARMIADYRDRLDLLKMSLGLSLQTPVTIDSSPLTSFRDVFEETNRWFLSPSRRLEDLDAIAGRLPSPGDVAIEGRSILDEVEREPGRLEEVLTLATRVALTNRREGVEPSDALELRVRRRLRHLAEIRSSYEEERRISVLAARELDTAFEQIIAPPAGAAPQRPGQTTLTLLGRSKQVAESRSRLVTLWAEFRGESLAFCRDLGVLPFEDWPSFHSQFTAQAGKPRQPQAKPEGN